jgi:hypothetical protein
LLTVLSSFSTIPAFSHHVTTYCCVSDKHVASIFRVPYTWNPADCYQHFRGTSNDLTFHTASHPRWQ